MHNLHDRFPGLADVSPTIRLYQKHVQQRDGQQQLEAQQALHAMIHQPLPGEPGYRPGMHPGNETKPHHAEAA